MQSNKNIMQILYTQSHNGFHVLHPQISPCCCHYSKPQLVLLSTLQFCFKSQFF